MVLVSLLVATLNSIELTVSGGQKLSVLKWHFDHMTINVPLSRLLWIEVKSEDVQFNSP